MNRWNSNDQLEPTVFVIFSGAGDLTWQRLVPALFDLSQDRSLPAGFSILAVYRDDLSDENLRRRQEVRASRHGEKQREAESSVTQRDH